MGGLGGESRKMAGKRKEEKEKDKRRSKKEMGKEGQARIGGHVRTVVRQLLPACGNPATHAQHSSRAGDPEYLWRRCQLHPSASSHGVFTHL